jgi:hypothetical protein
MRHERVVRAHLHDTGVIEDDNEIGHPHRGKTVRDENRDPAEAIPLVSGARSRERRAFKFTVAVSLQVGRDTLEELDYYRDKAAERRRRPGAPVGWLKDKFGRARTPAPQATSCPSARDGPGRAE